MERKGKYGEGGGKELTGWRYVAQCSWKRHVTVGSSPAAADVHIHAISQHKWIVPIIIHRVPVCEHISTAINPAIIYTILWIGDLVSLHTQIQTYKLNYTYILTEESDPVWVSQSVDQYSEVGLMKWVSDTNELCIFLHTSSQCFVPAHVAIYNTITSVLVLGELKGGRSRVWVGGVFGFVWDGKRVTVSYWFIM